MFAIQGGGARLCVVCFADVRVDHIYIRVERV